MAQASKTEHAFLLIRQPKPSGGKGGGEKIERVALQYNPKEYTIKKGAKWERKPAKGAKKAAMPEFQGADPSSMSLEVFLDAHDSPSGDITEVVKKLFECCTPIGETVGKNKPSPPFVEVGWGEKTLITGYVKSVSVKYTLFKPSGVPIRAVGTLEVEEIALQQGKQNPTSGALAAHRTHTVVAGDSLPSIAYDEYDDPTLWRSLADFNGVDDPMRLPVGTPLLIPPEEEAIALR